MDWKIKRLLEYCCYSNDDIELIGKDLNGNVYLESVANYFDRTWYVSPKQGEVIARIVNESLCHWLYKEVSKDV